MQDERTPLHNAAKSGNFSNARFLLEAGADALATDKVSSCVAIARHVNDIQYSDDGKHSVCYTKLSFAC